LPIFPDMQEIAFIQGEAVDISDKNNVEEEHYVHLEESFPIVHYPVMQSEWQS